MGYTYCLDKISVKRIEDALKKKTITKTDFYGGCEISKTTFNRMMGCGSVDRKTKEKVNRYLTKTHLLEEDLEWQEKEASSPKPEDEVNRTNQIQIALKKRIHEKCGTMRVLTMKEPIPTLEVYVNLDINSSDNKQRLHLDDNLANELVKRRENDQPHSHRLIVVGSTGTGKTMLLRSLALTCFQENSLNNKQHLPIYIRLRDYIEKEKTIPALEQYIVSEYDISISDIGLLSQTGQLLILLDGFDSIESNNKENVYNQINKFVDKFPNNDYIISCKNEERIFERFEQIQLCPLDEKQIRSLVDKRIKVKSPYLSEENKNKLLKEIKSDPDLFVIAQNPLLLVLICLTYEKPELKELKKEKWKVIHEAISVLLEGWDREQGITYETETNFSRRDKAKFLSLVAFHLIESGKDCLDRETLEEFIQEYIQKMLSNDPNRNTQKLYTVQDIFTSLESERSLLFRRSDWKYEFPQKIFRYFFAMIFIRTEFKSLDKFKSKDLYRKDPATWKKFLEVAENAYPIIFEDQVTPELASAKETDLLCTTNN
ncbi:NACHT domain-containing protein [Aetokthonos hydrillicola Thurmond2011]|jgi:predicted NACHT family NTPase|uniref:NACHT domain-containing protein n=1 Tax=Aetokthonos hydrillicola Thurmond2011 TaxID=2712845 RepID=A0AAP5M7Y8_9CYAN|nr:NACHT domain-containing protein [Aetokthonos hydrillicola]MBO3458569.1 NACHT domain-containing protein [Aetokthonos hydrillicola CCALA 1050]MBW4585012.1 NACHT domain-containing protein [Aetokthonos hydrillicola CCALA 1050]MDR9894227.1 NACHT domain-containing protein [Aetokthonos hydrillicola Thurmond2011]